MAIIKFVCFARASSLTIQVSITSLSLKRTVKVTVAYFLVVFARGTQNLEKMSTKGQVCFHTVVILTPNEKVWVNNTHACCNCSLCSTEYTLSIFRQVERGRRKSPAGQGFKLKMRDNMNPSIIPSTLRCLSS